MSLFLSILAIFGLSAWLLSSPPSGRQDDDQDDHPDAANTWDPTIEGMQQAELQDEQLEAMARWRDEPDHHDD